MYNIRRIKTSEFPVDVMPYKYPPNSPNKARVFANLAGMIYINAEEVGHVSYDTKNYFVSKYRFCM